MCSLQHDRTYPPPILDVKQIVDHAPAWGEGRPEDDK
jgi:hypothetical protein